MGTVLADFPSVSGSYGDYTFSPSCLLLSAVHTPIYDEAKRTVAATQHVFVLKDMIQAASQLDPNWPSHLAPPAGTTVGTLQIRQQLLIPAQTLVLRGFGVDSKGDVGNLFRCNSAIDGTPWDAAWGPLPQKLEWQDIGNGKAGWLTWQISCQTPEQCDDPAYKGPVIMAFNFDYHVNKDQSGYSKRVISGYIEIPITRKTAADRTLPYCVDQLKEQCYPDIPSGFRRTDDTWKMSKDRRRADFSCTDEQLPPNAPPPHMVHATASHTVESVPGLGFVSWQGHLEAEYEPAFNTAPGVAWGYFVDLLYSRLLQTKKVTDKDDGTDGIALIPLKLTMSEPEIYGRKRARFSCDYQYTMSAGDASGGKVTDLMARAFRDKAVAASALWTAAPHNSADLWLNSMIVDRVLTARGRAGLVFDLASDSIIDLCEPTETTPEIRTITTRPPGDGGGASATLTTKLPSPSESKSWLYYQHQIQSDVRHLTTELKPLPSGSISIPQTQVKVDASDGYKVPEAGTPESVIQIRNGPSMSITFAGRALRAGFPITPPKLLTYGGVPCVPVREWFATSIVADYGIPVAAARWWMEYRLTRPPTQGVKPPGNPMMGTLAKPPALTGFISLP